MKIIKSIREIWKANRREYLISCGVLILGCSLIYAMVGSPLEYSIPISLSGSLFLMFVFGFATGDKE